MNSSYATWAARWRVALGFALGAAYLILSRPTVALLIAGSTVASWGLLLRAYAAGHLDKNRKLAISGPYRYTRNPLYLGSFLLGLGFVIAGGSWAVGVAFMVFFLVIYWPVMRREEDHLRRHFGEAYSRYAENVSLFFPTRRGPAAPGEPFRWAQYLKNREHKVALGYVAGIIFLALKAALRS